MKLQVLSFGKKHLYPDWARIISILLIPTVVFIACRKSSSKSEPLIFNPDSAKEWYYGSFQKSAEYQSYNAISHGDKSPNWTKSTYQKIGKTEIIEFPLVKTKGAISVPFDNTLTSAEAKRIAEASQARLVFIKSANNDIVVREIDYIPGWSCLKSTGFDISHNSIGQLGDNFSGQLVIKKWNGEELSTSIVSAGRFTGRKTGRRLVTAANTALVNKISRVNSCTDILIIEFERFCTGTWHGFQLVDTDCTPWTQTGNSWYETVCEETSGCSTGYLSEECICSLFGLCGGGGSGDDGNYEENCDMHLDQLAAGQEVSDNLPGTILEEDDLARQYDYPWKVYKQDQGLWHIESNEIGTHMRQDTKSLWEFVNLVHGTLTLSGRVIGGNIEPIYVSGTPTIGIYNASMKLKYKIKASLVCKGSPLSRTDPYQSVGYFPANP